MKKLRWNMILMSVVYLALGIILLLWPQAVLDAICYIVGTIVILTGVFQILRFLTAKGSLWLAPLTLTTGVICLALGLFLIVRADIVQTVLPVVFGLFVIFDSVMRVQNALELKKCENSSWLPFLGLALLSIALGAIMIYNPFGTISTLVMAVGVILVIEGALNLISTLYTVAAVHSYMKEHPAVEAAIEEATGEDLNGDGMIGRHSTLEGTAVEVDAPAEDNGESIGSSESTDSKED